MARSSLPENWPGLFRTTPRRSNPRWPLNKLICRNLRFNCIKKWQPHIAVDQRAVLKFNPAELGYFTVGVASKGM
jgi:hypothetical protein